MHNDEQRLIDSLFTRLKQAESQSTVRDAQAETQILQHIAQQPTAPYYMTQALLIQEAAMKQLNQRVSELEGQLAQQRSQSEQSSGGFLSGLFGGGQRTQPLSPSPQAAPVQNPAWGNTAAAAQTAPRGTGFLGGALQTAVGVAGGVVMANMLTNMFHQSQPQEIVNIINEPSDADAGFSQQNSGFLQDANWPTDNTDNLNGFNDYDNNDFGNSDFDDDSFI
ncbi:ABC transporter substrate-binding protein [Enterobacterales bacterium CwR94]|nr:ABC transporter substrate-binding protein [Enterobacterales bacterium CwR94]